MKIFLTGGTGFIGSHFIRHALDEDHGVTAISRRPPNCQIQEVKWIKTELDQVPSYIMEHHDVLVHLAAHGSNDPQNASWEESFRCNVTQSIRLWEKAHTAGIKRFIICGSCFEYGRSGNNYDFIPTDAPLLPTAPYHASKGAATLAALAFAVDKNVELLILRPFHVYGEGEAPNRFWPSLRKAAKNGDDFPMTNGSQIRDFVPVEQVSKSFLNACECRDLIPGRPVIKNLGSGKPRTLLEFAQSEWKSFNATGKLLPGVKSQRENEVMRYVPLLE